MDQKYQHFILFIVFLINSSLRPIFIEFWNILLSIYQFSTQSHIKIISWTQARNLATFAKVQTCSELIAKHNLWEGLTFASDKSSKRPLPKSNLRSGLHLNAIMTFILINKQLFNKLKLNRPKSKKLGKKNLAIQPPVSIKIPLVQGNFRPSKKAGSPVPWEIPRHFPCSLLYDVSRVFSRPVTWI
mgnify:CR=1 FL=1